ncbi:MAG: hypothetical protein ABGX63_01580 [bacterium]
MGKAALLAFDGTAVAAAFAGAFAFALGAAGTAVGEVEPLLAAGIDVAEDPQANNKATNNRTIALGRCLINRGFNLDISGGSPFSFVRYELKACI